MWQTNTWNNVDKDASFYKSKLEHTKDTPYLPLTSELWDVFHEDFWENRPCYNGTIIYICVYVYVIIYVILLRDVLLRKTLTKMIEPNILQMVYRDQSRYAPSQWEMSLHCNDISHWLGPYLDWSLVHELTVQILKISLCSFVKNNYLISSQFFAHFVACHDIQNCDLTGPLKSSCKFS